MTYRGHVKDGVVILEDAGSLPDGTPVQVEPLNDSEVLPTLAERFEDVAGKAVGLPSDMAKNHDHYLHGQPKRRDE